MEVPQTNYNWCKCQKWSTRIKGPCFKNIPIVLKSGLKSVDAHFAKSPIGGKAQKAWVE